MSAFLSLHNGNIIATDLAPAEIGFSEADRILASLSGEQFAPKNMTANNSPSPYVASASSAYPGYIAYKCFDGPGGTLWWCTAGGNPTGWVKIDLGNGNARGCGSYALKMPSDVTSRFPRDWTLQGSDNDSDWTTVDTRTGVSFANNETRNFPCNSPSPTAFRYWRVNITANNGDTNYVEIDEIYLYSSDQLSATEIPCTAFGRSILDDADAAAVHSTLGLGGAAVLNVGTGAGTVAAGNDSRFVTDGNSHDHYGGDGAQVAHTYLSGLGNDEHTLYIKADGARAFTGKIQSSKAIATGGGHSQLISFSTQTLTPNAAENVSAVFLSVRNTDPSPGNSFVWGLAINTEGDSVDSGGALGGTNFGNADWQYINNCGKASGTTTPTAIGIELNKGSGAERNANFKGFGLQVYDFSTTSLADGATGVFLKKESNANTLQPLLKLQANRSAIQIVTPEGSGYDGTNFILLGIQKSNGDSKSNFTADGQLNFINGLGVTFQSSSGNQGWIFNDTNSPSWLVLRGGPAGARFLNNAHSANLLEIENGGNVIVTGGYLGVNTSPTTRLHIKGTTDAQARATIEATETGSFTSLLFKNDAREWLIGVPAWLSNSFLVYDGTASATRLSIDTSGVVNISNSLNVGGSKFSVDANGNLTKINNVTLSWPSSNSAGVLKNNGSGTLTWDVGGGSGQAFVQKAGSVFEAQVNQSPWTEVGSKQLSITAGDIIQFEFNGYVYNNAGATRTYRAIIRIGSTDCECISSTTIAAGSTTAFWVRGTICVRSSSRTLMHILTAPLAAAAAGTGATVTLRHAWQTSTSDFTGTQTVRLLVGTSGSGTQLVSGSFTISQIPQIT